MTDWVVANRPYRQVDKLELHTGTVLRRVPFTNSSLGESSFALAVDGKASKVALDTVTSESIAARGDQVVVSPGIVLTPDCDIFQHKVNRIVVAQIVSIEAHVKNQGLNSEKKGRLFESMNRSRATNPGAFNQPGLFPLHADKTLGFEDHLVLLENLASIPIQYSPGQSQGAEVISRSVNGLDNIWFWIHHPGLRIRLINEFARHMLRIGLADTGGKLE